MNNNLLQQIMLQRNTPQRRDKSNILWYSFLLYHTLQNNGVLQRIQNNFNVPRTTIILALATFIVHYFGGEIQSAIPALHVAANNIPNQAIQPAAILYNRQWYRIYTGILYHIDDNHMYYNLASLLSKGIQLEDMLGTTEFIRLTVILIGMTGITHTTLAYLLYSVFNISKYMTQYSVGMSGLLFAYKAVLSHYAPNLQYNVMGFTVGSKYASWLELCLIYMIAPNSSFLGHLSGIAAGLLYVQIIEYIQRQRVHNGRIGRGTDTVNQYINIVQRKLYTIYRGLYKLVFTAPQPPRSVNNAGTPLTQAMTVLREAGFRDLRRNAEVLRQTNYNVDAAIDILLQEQR